MGYGSAGRRRISRAFRGGGARPDGRFDGGRARGVRRCAARRRATRCARPGRAHRVAGRLVRAEVRASQLTACCETTLRAARHQDVLVGGQRVETDRLRGHLPGPQLKARPGDRLQIALVNDLPDAVNPVLLSRDRQDNAVPQITNLHVHGFHVSPKSPSDDVFLDIAPGTTFHYEYEIPANHPTGTYWYHPHRHEWVSHQIFSGHGRDDHHGGRPGRSARAWRGSASALRAHPDDDQGREDRERPQGWHRHLAAGERPPAAHRAHPAGETQRWRLLNAAEDIFLPARARGPPAARHRRRRQPRRRDAAREAGGPGRRIAPRRAGAGSGSGQLPAPEHLVH